MSNIPVCLVFFFICWEYLHFFLRKTLQLAQVRQHCWMGRLIDLIQSSFFFNFSFRKFNLNEAFIGLSVRPSLHSNCKTNCAFSIATLSWVVPNGSLFDSILGLILNASSPNKAPFLREVDRRAYNFASSCFRKIEIKRVCKICSCSPFNLYIRQMVMFVQLLGRRVELKSQQLLQR